MEKKKLVTQALLIALLLADLDVANLEYTKADDYEEFVTIRYKNGYEKNVCVTADSCVALMKDVLAQV